MSYPSFEVRNGIVVENDGNGHREKMVFCNDRRLRSRVVPHEDIWNLSRLPKVRDARFIYSLNDNLMDLFTGPIDVARERLVVPTESVMVWGHDTVIVTVKGIQSDFSRSMAWSVDHNLIWQQHGINGVQYQTAKSVLFAVTMLTEGFVPQAGSTYNASTMPLNDEGWAKSEEMMKTLGIYWRELEQGDAPVIVD